MADVISIEEANQIRAALGFKALPTPGGGPVFKEPTNGVDSHGEDGDPGSTLESRQAAGYDNWKALQGDADEKAKREAKNAAVKKARDAARRFAKLEGKGLGEADGDDADTKTWLLQQKRRRKQVEKARKLERELADRELQAEYTSADLAGVKVGHEVGDFEEDEQVLTLKDTTIDANEEDGDELENLDLRERERRAEKSELKKKRPAYDPNDVDEGGNNSLLAQYDEVIDGKQQKRFTLDGQGSIAEQKAAVKEARDKLLINLDRSGTATLLSFSRVDMLTDLANNAVSDYVAISEIKMRKPKKKKAKSTRQRVTDEDESFPTTEARNGEPENENENVNAMELDSGKTTSSSKGPKKRSLDDTSYIDDDDLQASLAAQRRNALKKRNKMRPEDIARRMREEASATPATDEPNGDVQNQEEDGGLVIDETSEFVANLQKPTVQNKQRRSTPKPKNGTTNMAGSPPNDNGDGDVDMERSYNDVDDEAELKDDIRESSTARAATPDMTSTGLSDETTLNKGIGATLAMLSQRGLIKGSDSGDLNALHRERQRFLAEKQQREADAERRARLQRERDRASGKLDRMSGREKEAYAQHENKQRDQHESRHMADIFNREYKPDIDIRYVDEFGRAMNQKEAFKHLSHQFHGKGSGKQKTEKRLKKIEDEKKREAMSSLDSSERTGMNNAMGVTARKNRQAGVRLA
ncbi:MAG: hypothetical protein M1837_005897 [Sclerophora amabilis]|nr:MAG: hypothetical protein M1837_005897 [Sclerophora amabilis]